MIEISVNGVNYPARPSMGALLYLKREFGLDYVGETPLEIAEYLYCVVKATCKNEGREFTMSGEEFLCAINLDDVQDAVARLFPVSDNNNNNNYFISDSESAGKKRE